MIEKIHYVGSKSNLVHSSVILPKDKDKISAEDLLNKGYTIVVQSRSGTLDVFHKVGSGIRRKHIENRPFVDINVNSISSVVYNIIQGYHTNSIHQCDTLDRVLRGEYNSTNSFIYSVQGFKNKLQEVTFGTDNVKSDSSLYSRFKNKLKELKQRLS